MTLYLHTRGRSTDYRFITDAPPTPWWSERYSRVTSFESPTLLVERDAEGWRVYLSGLRSKRVDRVETRIRYTLVFASTTENEDKRSPPPGDESSPPLGDKSSAPLGDESSPPLDDDSSAPQGVESLEESSLAPSDRAEGTPEERRGAFPESAKEPPEEGHEPPSESREPIDSDTPVAESAAQAAAPVASNALSTDASLALATIRLWLAEHINATPKLSSALDAELTEQLIEPWLERTSRASSSSQGVGGESKAVYQEARTAALRALNDAGTVELTPGSEEEKLFERCEALLRGGPDGVAAYLNEIRHEDELQALCDEYQLHAGALIATTDNGLTGPRRFVTRDPAPKPKPEEKGEAERESPEASSDPKADSQVGGGQSAVSRVVAVAAGVVVLVVILAVVWRSK